MPATPDKVTDRRPDVLFTAAGRLDSRVITAIAVTLCASIPIASAAPIEQAFGKVGVLAAFVFAFAFAGGLARLAKTGPQRVPLVAGLAAGVWFGCMLLSPATTAFGPVFGTADTIAVTAVVITAVRRFIKDFPGGLS